MSYIWERLIYLLIFIALIAFMVCLVINCIHRIVLSKAPCPEYHRYFSSHVSHPTYCDHCGECLRPSCSCGYEWEDDQQYCPDCGFKR